MKVIPFLFPIAIALLVSSCVSKAKFNEMNQQYVLQDSLRASKEIAINDLEKRNKELLFAKQELEKKIKETEEKYEQLKNESNLSEANLSAQLNEKQAELDNKKKILETFASELESREDKVRELNATLAYQDSVSKALLGKIENALVNFGKEDLTVEQRDGKVYVSLSEQLLFQSGSSSVNNKGRKALLNLADVLNKQEDITVMIEGHTDNVPIRTGKYQDNWDLSVMRATEVVRILVWGGKVDPGKLIASGRASYLPIASNETKDGKKLNRRTEIILTPNLDELMSLINRK